MMFYHKQISRVHPGAAAECCPHDYTLPTTCCCSAVDQWLLTITVFNLENVCVVCHTWCQFLDNHINGHCKFKKVPVASLMEQ